DEKSCLKNKKVIHRGRERNGHFCSGPALAYENYPQSLQIPLNQVLFATAHTKKDKVPSERRDLVLFSWLFFYSPFFFHSLIAWLEV
ncbi:MAG: hypothetical protein II443_05110, partial [Oscillospiraceae bacterium]|nr:hypothetical protein [Oscillospiraceae bacterium]